MSVTKSKCYKLLSLSLVATLLMGIFVVSNTTTAEAKAPYDISAKISSILDDALDWIKYSQKENGGWGNELIINDSAYGVYALRTNGLNYEKGLDYLANYDMEENTDTLSHVLMTVGEDNAYVEKLLSLQNDDGGFGINKQYASEPFDTLLALEALASINSNKYDNTIQKMIMYLISNQQEDGSWKINEYNESETAFTARVAYSIGKYLKDHNLTSAETENAFYKTDALLSSNSLDMTEQEIEKNLYIQFYRNSRGNYTRVYDVVKAIDDVQQDNGSFYDSVYDTYLVVRYLNSLNTIDENYQISDMSVTLDKNTALINEETEINGSYELLYTTVTQKELNITTNIYKDGEVIYSEESSVTLSDDSNSASGTAFKYSVNEAETAVLKAVMVLSDGKKDIKTVTNLIYVQEKPVIPETKLTDAGIVLSEHFGYVGQSVKVNAKAYLLYSTNVNYIITAKTTVTCGGSVVKKSEKQLILKPDSTSLEVDTVELSINEDKNAVYKFSTEFYDGEKLLTVREDAYQVYDDPNQGIPEEEKNNTITQFDIKLDSYCTYVSPTPINVSAKCEMLYNIYQDINIVVNGYILDGDKEIASSKKDISLSKDSTGQTFDLVSATLDISKDKEYIFKAVMINTDGTKVGEKIVKFTVQECPEIPLKLGIETNTGEDYSVDLSWNDISSSYEQYGYRVLRSSDNKKTWETRSTWNETQQVKVLNIYPNYYSRNYLIDWMNKIGDTNTNEPISKNLFIIDNVLIDEYNNDPEKYLKDKNGAYQYDVLMFGTYDSNAFKDLSDISCKATHEFVDSGRGVLFGHDTVCLVGAQRHPNFATFENELGIKLSDRNIQNRSTSVSVVNQGFLTSFPWNISGTLTIPTTHTLGQYTGGSLEGTVWMTINAPYDTDAETGATNNAYLVSNNQLALIQTGDSNGQSTVDECKVFANTLFYLKQLTSETNARDNSFYDEAAPVKPEVDYLLDKYSRDSYSITVKMSAKDFGTTYYYKIEGIPKSDSSENVMSNTAIAEAFSDMQGFIVFTTDSADSAVDMIQYAEDGKTPLEIIKAENGIAEYHMNDLKKDKKYYLHIFAIDNQNNISEEYVKQICDNQEILSKADVISSLVSDKPLYYVGDTVVITSESYTRGKAVDATAELVLQTFEGENLHVLDDSINIQLTSMSRWSKEYNLSTKSLQAGKYMAVISWKVDGNIVSQSKCLIRVAEHETQATIKLDADVVTGTGYSNTLKWTNLNDVEESVYVPTYFSIVVDCSGSMSGSRRTSAQDAINLFIDQINEQDQMNIIGFESSARKFCDFTNNRTVLHEAVKSIYASGGTSVNSGMNASVSEFGNIVNESGNYNKVIILLCDGDVNNCSEAIQNSIENNIVIYTINVVNADVTDLQNMASQTGGKYYYTNVVSDMSEILHKIKLVNDKGNYYYNVIRDGEVINALTKNEYLETGFKDIDKPVILSAQLNASNIGDDKFDGYIDVIAKDIGTDYEYVIDAVEKTNEDNIITSNIAVTTALSDIKGYAYSIDTDSAEKPETAYNDEAFVAGGKNIRIDLKDCERGQIYYLHLYAIDNAGNISDETTYSFVVGMELFKAQGLSTDISTDKETYSYGENINIKVSAQAESYKMYAKAVIEVCDDKGNTADVVEPNYVAEIPSYEALTREFIWTADGVVSGNYQASIKWYDGDKVIASDNTYFKIDSDGKIDDSVSTDKIAYMTNELIILTDYIYNNTTNTYGDLDIDIDIVDKFDKVVSSVSGKVDSYAGKVKEFNKSIHAEEIGIGEYKAVSHVKMNDNLVASSSSKFTVSENTDPSIIFKGNISAENYDDKNKLIKYNVTNASKTECKNAVVKASIYTENGLMIDTIEETVDFADSETKTFEKVYNTEALPIGIYPVVLSVVVSDGEAILSESSFNINLINKYQVKFVDYDGTELSVQQVEYGSSAHVPSDPQRPSDAKYSYSFKGWDTDFSSIKTDLIVTALYDQTLNEYTVKFISDGKVISAQSVKYGNAAVAPENPTKADDEQYSYTFKGWKKDFGNIVSDLEVEAQFEEHLKTVSDVSVPNSSEPEKEVSSPASEISENSSTSSQPESSVPESSVEESRNNVSTGQSDDISLLLLIFVLSLAIGTVGIMTGKNSYSRRKNK